MIIRKAVWSDAEAIAECLLLAMEEIVFHFIGDDDPVKAKKFLLHFVERENNQYSYENCRVVESDGKIVAAIDIYDGADLHALRAPVIAYVRGHYNPDFDPEDETGAGEFYIDSLGVAPGQQGKGIGSKLLDHVIDEYVTRNHQTLGLLVDEDNPDAKKLYLKLGFISAGKTTLAGKRMEHLQIRN